MSDESRPSPAQTPVAAVIPAAGRGVRLGPGAPKALRALNGTPMLLHAVRALGEAVDHAAEVRLFAPIWNPSNVSHSVARDSECDSLIVRRVLSLKFRRPRQV